MSHLPLVPGTSLRFSIGDFDAEDEYTFTVVGSGSSLQLRWSGAGESEQELTLDAEALERGPGMLSFSQGSATALFFDEDAGERRYTSPEEAGRPCTVSWLLPREAYRTVRAEGAVQLQPLWDSPDSDRFVCEAEETRAVELNGAAVDVPVVVLRGAESGAELVVVADERWPLVLVRDECGGDNVARLIDVTTGGS